MNKIVIITDPGKALDDEEMLLVLSRLHSMRLVEPVAVVANLSPVLSRARLAAGTLQMLGLSAVPVGSGSPVLRTPVQDEADFHNISYLLDANRIVEGRKLLVDTLEGATEKSLTLLLVSAMTDAAALLAGHEELFASRIESVVLMGGVLAVNDSIFLDTDGYMHPDSAVNNFYDQRSAAFLYRRLQELSIPMVVLSRNAAYACKISRLIYDCMATSVNPIGCRLSMAYRDFVQDFWRAVNASPGDPDHEALPARWNRSLFLSEFCDGLGQDISADESVLDLVKHSAISDPMALIAAVPELRRRFYEPEPVTIRGAEHLIIGVSRRITGLKDEAALRSFLVDQLLSALGLPV